MGNFGTEKFEYFCFVASLCVRKFEHFHLTLSLKSEFNFYQLDSAVSIFAFMRPIEGLSCLSKRIVAADFTRKLMTHSGMQMSFTINKSIKTDFD